MTDALHDGMLEPEKSAADGALPKSPHAVERAATMAVFLSHGIGLATWDEKGMFSREVGYYRALAKSAGAVLFVTCDKPGDRLGLLLERICPMSALHNTWGLPYQLFGLLAPILHRKRLAQCRLFKSNQLSGAWTATLAARLLHKPLIVRCGFVRSQFAKWLGLGRCRRFIGLRLERFSVRRADLIFVATENDRQYLADTHGIPLERFRIVRNPIDTERFCAMPEVAKEPGKVLFVGRLSRQKNVHLLIDACRRVAGARLTIAGAGELEAELRTRSAGIDVEFLGNVPNEQLPALLNSAEVFALPSLFEGSPKTLLEAMACGAAVVGADAPGIRGVIEHRQNGLLCPATVEAFAAAIAELLGDASLRARLGEAAAEMVREAHSHATVIATESAAIASLVQSQRQAEASIASDACDPISGGC